MTQIKFEASNNFLVKKKISLSLSNLFLGLWFYLYLVFAIFRYIPDILIKDEIIGIITILIGLVPLPLHLSRLSKKYSLLYFLISFILIGFLICSLVIGKGKLGVILLVLSNVSGLLFLIRKKLNISLVSLIFISVFSCFFYYMINGFNPNSLPAYMSRNGISWVMIFAVIFVYIAYHQSTKLIPLWPAIMTFIICVWAFGRSGIISSGLLLLGIIFLKIQQMGIKSFKLLAIVFIILFFSFFMLDEDVLPLNQYIISYFRYFEVAGLNPTGREEIWSHYFNQLQDPLYFVFGPDLLRDSYMSQWNYNYHNSFISLHERIGIFAIPVMGTIGVSLFRYWFNNKLYFLLLLVFIVRISTDMGVFFSSFDFLIYYLLLKSFIKNPIEVKKTYHHTKAG